MTKKELLELEDKINNPLAIICGCSEMMMSSNFSGSRQKLAEEINVAGWKINKYIRSLKTITQKENKKIQHISIDYTTKHKY